jgi:peroxiredoxin
MRYLIVCLFLMTSQLATAADATPGYQQGLDQFLKQSAASPSPFTEADRAIMDKAARTLAANMPDPGIKVGMRAPDFTLKNALGKNVTLKDELKKGPVILVFYRGAWCPFCNLHLHTLEKSLPLFKEYNAQLITVTPQTPDKSAEQIKKDGYPFEVLSDTDSQVMKAYKLYYELPDDLIAVYKNHGLDIEAFNGKGRNVLPVPGSFVIDQQGRVRAMQAETDYKQRMEPARMIYALKAIAAGNK